MNIQKLLSWSLFISIITNACLAGFVVSFAFHRSGPPPSPFERMHKATASLSAEHRTMVEKLISDNENAIESNMMSMHEAFRSMHDILTAPQLDKAALQKVHDKIQKGDDTTKEDMGDLMKDIAESLSDEERIRFFNEIMPEDGPFGPPPHDMPPPR